MSKRTHQSLSAAMKDGALVRFRRRFEDCTILGYVLDVGPKFFLLCLVNDRIRYDGFECFRISDVNHLKPDPYTSFVEGALAIRRLRKPRKPRIDLSTVESILTTANRSFPLVTIHEEERDPDVCHIGRVLGIDGDKLSLLEIAPGAVWENAPTPHSIKEITRINFGGDYEDALHLVGGDPPTR